MCGGGGAVGPVPSEGDIREVERSSSDEQERTEFKTELNTFLGDVLREANDRDAEAVARHLDTVQQALEGLLEEAVELRFGGSVSKHTYVDGLSDVDLLAIVGRNTAADASPASLIKDFAEAIANRLPNTEVETGQMSVKVRFQDGVELQILPAFRVGDGFQIPRPRGETWSEVIRPAEFATRLTEVNQSNSGKVVPIIKLFKIAQERLPERTRLAGYHIEAIAVEAFRDYHGSLDRAEMFLHLASVAAQMTLKPLAETTGQSAYVDGYLGSEGSEDRARASAALQRLATKLGKATERNGLEDWYEVFQG